MKVINDRPELGGRADDVGRRSPVAEYIPVRRVEHAFLSFSAAINQLFVAPVAHMLEYFRSESKSLIVPAHLK